LTIKIPPSSIGQLVSVIRAQLATRVDVNSLKQRPSAGQSPTKSRTPGPENLETVIGQRVRAINRDDPKLGRKAFHIFLEAILFSHFGEQLINDPKFHQIIDDVQDTMEADTELRPLIDAAIEHLLSESR
jgi:hypothetical protein